jgi:hypothetical protein
MYVFFQIIIRSDIQDNRVIFSSNLLHDAD